MIELIEKDFVCQFKYGNNLNSRSSKQLILTLIQRLYLYVVKWAFTQFSANSAYS